jgi:hypothetical protein
LVSVSGRIVIVIQEIDNLRMGLDRLGLIRDIVRLDAHGASAGSCNIDDFRSRSDRRGANVDGHGTRASSVSFPVTTVWVRMLSPSPDMMMMTTMMAWNACRIFWGKLRPERMIRGSSPPGFSIFPDVLLDNNGNLGVQSADLQQRMIAGMNRDRQSFTGFAKVEICTSRRRMHALVSNTSYGLAASNCVTNGTMSFVCSGKDA